MPHGGFLADCVPLEVSQYGFSIHFANSSSVVVMYDGGPCLGIPKVLYGRSGVYRTLLCHIGIGVILNKSVLCCCGCNGIAIVDM